MLGSRDIASLRDVVGAGRRAACRVARVGWGSRSSRLREGISHRRFGRRLELELVAPAGVVGGPHRRVEAHCWLEGLVGDLVAARADPAYHLEALERSILVHVEGPASSDIEGPSQRGPPRSPCPTAPAGGGKPTRSVGAPDHLEHGRGAMEGGLGVRGGVRACVHRRTRGVCLRTQGRRGRPSEL